MLKQIKSLYWDVAWWWKFRIKGSVDPESVVAPPPQPVAIKETQRRQAADKRVVDRWMHEVQQDMSKAAIAERIDEPYDQDGGYARLELMAPDSLISREEELAVREEFRQFAEANDLTEDFRDAGATPQEQLFQRSRGL